MLHVLTPAEMAGSNLPAADALGRVLGPASSKVVTVLALISVVAIANLTMMLYTRTVFAVARDGALPGPLARVAPGGTPRLALAVTVLTALGFAVAGGYDTLLAISAPPWMLMNILVDLSALRLRQTEPDLPRPFRMPLYPLPALIGVAMNTLLMAAMVYEDPKDSLIGLVGLAAIGAIYLLQARMVAAPQPA
jgi:APA family basic amino acid/polyamine antiporter